MKVLCHVSSDLLYIGAVLFFYIYIWNKNIYSNFYFYYDEELKTRSKIVWRKGRGSGIVVLFFFFFVFWLLALWRNHHRWVALKAAELGSLFPLVESLQEETLWKNGWTILNEEDSLLNNFSSFPHTLE